MREEFKCAYDIKIRTFFDKIYKLIGLSIILLAFTSFAYMFYWVLGTSNELYLELGKPVFEPLAKILNFGSTEIHIYKNTSKICFFSIIAMLIARITISKIETDILSKYLKKEEEKFLKEKKLAQKRHLVHHDTVQAYSICLSINIEREKTLSSEQKQKINNAIFNKISKQIISIEPNAKHITKDVLIITSNNFSKYDEIHDAILKQLSLANNTLNTKYKINLVPNMTTDAHSNIQIGANIRKQHLEIQSFNFKNKSLTTTAFSNKYNQLNYSKYAGLPIGEFVYFGNENTKTYELNVVQKNSGKILK